MDGKTNNRVSGIRASITSIVQGVCVILASAEVPSSLLLGTSKYFLSFTVRKVGNSRHGYQVT